MRVTWGCGGSEETSRASPIAPPKNIRDRAIDLHHQGLIPQDIYRSTLPPSTHTAGSGFLVASRSRSRSANNSLAHSSVTAEIVVMTNGSGKDNRTLFRRWGQSVNGTPAGVRTRFTRGERFSIPAAISVDGYVASCVVVGAVDSQELFGLHYLRWYICACRFHYPPIHIQNSSYRA